MKSRSGFTLVEVIIAVSVIAILSAVSVFSFTAVQRQSRDNQRAAKATLIVESLEKYYEKNGEYPPCPAVTDTAVNVVTDTLIGVDKAVFLTPQEKTNTTNSIRCTDLTTLTQPDFFGYVGDGSSNCQTGDACLSFKLKYKKEAEYYFFLYIF